MTGSAVSRQLVESERALLLSPVIGAHQAGLWLWRTAGGHAGGAAGRMAALAAEGGGRCIGLQHLPAELLPEEQQPC